jgi:signal transduction histidine kinase
MKNRLQDKSGSVEHAGRSETASGLLAAARDSQARDWRGVAEVASARTAPREVAFDAERQRLFALLNRLPALVYLKAPDYTIRFANRYFRERFGDPGTEPCYQVLHGLAQPCEQCVCASVMEERRPVEWERAFPDGKVYQLYDYPFVDVDGTEMVLQLGIDITQRKEAEAALERTNEELLALSQAERDERLLAQALAEAILTLNSSLDLTEVLDRILEQTERVIPCDAATVVLLQDGQVQLVRKRGSRSLEELLVHLRSGSSLEMAPMLEAACREGQPVLMQDIARMPRQQATPGLEWVRSVAVVPLVHGQETIGLIALFSDQPGFFTRKSVHRLEAFASHAVMAIWNARLYRAQAEAARTAEFLSSASLVLTETLELDAVLDNLLDILTYLVPYDCGSVSLLEANAHLVTRATRGYGGRARQEVLGAVTVEPGNDAHLATVLGDCKSVWIPDTERHPGWSPRPGLEGACSYLGVPLIVDGKAIGLCEMVKHGNGAFTQQHLWWAEALSGQAAIAIQNAWLFERMRESREQLQSLSRRLVDVQENERRYIARELHDEAGQALTTLRIQLKLLERQAGDPQAVQAATAELLQMAEGVMENLHRLAVVLRPASLDHLGLAAAVQQHCEMVGRQHGLIVEFQVADMDRRMPPDVETALYRIVQEALTNVVRHAQASRVEVLLERRRDKVRVVVRDDGVGFDPECEPGSEHLGLIGIKERAVALGGTLTIDSTPNEQTSIRVEVPYVDQSPDS